MTRDRTYYRSLPDSELVEQATYGERIDWQELAIVLSERLEAKINSHNYYDPHDDD
jgi:hypothetical protein